MKFEHTRTMNWEGAFRGMHNPMNSWNKSDSIFGICNVADWPSHNFSSGKEFRQYLDNKGYLLDKEGNIRRVAYKVYESYPYAEVVSIGDDDLKLAQKLILAGSEHRKFMRQIFVCVDITAPMYWWKEFDTYKVATVRNSCSTMHKLHTKKLTTDDFEHDAIDIVIKSDFTVEKMLTGKDPFERIVNYCESLRNLFNETKKKKYWRALIQSLPDSYLMKATLTFSYETLFGMCSKGQRRFHKLNEWSGIDNPDVPNFIGWARTLPYSKELIFIDETEKAKDHGKH